MFSYLSLHDIFTYLCLEWVGMRKIQNKTREMNRFDWKFKENCRTLIGKLKKNEVENTEKNVTKNNYAIFLDFQLRQNLF
jgi:hypothetical protein